MNEFHSSRPEPFSPSRRELVVAGTMLFGSAFIPKIASAAGTRDPRLVVIILRGALDGLAAVGPVGDPEYAALHGSLALRFDGPNAGLPLDGFFALNPGMPVFAKMYRDNQAAVVHATATNYRERSHFDGQDVLESGMPGPGFTESGWLNRAIAAIPKGERVGRLGGLAIGPATPLVLRGNAPVVGWAPEVIPSADDDLARRVMDLYRHSDPMLAQVFGEGLQIDKIAARDMGADRRDKGGPGTPAGMRQAAEGAARLIAADDGPRVAALAFDGWDTHEGEGGATGRLMQLLGGLDGAFDAFKTGLGPKWADTAIIAMTEFGRTAKINGTNGTDHGTGTVAFLAGGAVRGGRVIADWPGLKEAQLFEKRDLMATTDVRSVVKGLLAGQFGLSPTVLGQSVFPGTMAVPPFQGLVV